MKTRRLAGLYAIRVIPLAIMWIIAFLHRIACRLCLGYLKALFFQKRRRLRQRFPLHIQYTDALRSRADCQFDNRAGGDFPAGLDIAPSRAVP